MNNLSFKVHMSLNLKKMSNSLLRNVIQYLRLKAEEKQRVRTTLACNKMELQMVKYDQCSLKLLCAQRDIQNPN